jgi:hypothetical protein
MKWHSDEVKAIGPIKRSPPGENEMGMMKQLGLMIEHSGVVVQASDRFIGRPLI